MGRVLHSLAGDFASLSANQDQIVPMNDFRFVYVAEQVFYFWRGFPGD
jgi:hypothetical protein